MLLHSIHSAVYLKSTAVLLNDGRIQAGGLSLHQTSLIHLHYVLNLLLQLLKGAHRPTPDVGERTKERRH